MYQKVVNTKNFYQQLVPLLCYKNVFSKLYLIGLNCYNDKKIHIKVLHRLLLKVQIKYVEIVFFNCKKITLRVFVLPTWYRSCI